MWLCLRSSAAVLNSSQWHGGFCARSLESMFRLDEDTFLFGFRPLALCQYRRGGLALSNDSRIHKIKSLLGCSIKWPWKYSKLVDKIGFNKLDKA